MSFFRDLRADRRVLRLIYESVQRLENTVTAASEYMTTALAGLDAQLVNLQARLSAEAEALSAAIAAATLGAEDSAALTAAADRVSATAALVAGLVAPSVVADPETPDVPGEIVV